MNRDICSILKETLLLFLDKEALAAHLSKRGIENSVALGDHFDQVNLKPWVMRHQTGRDVLGLPERQRTLSGCDPQNVGHWLQFSKNNTKFIRSCLVIREALKEDQDAKPTPSMR